MVIQIIFLLTRIRKRNVVEGEDWGRQPVNVFKVESQGSRLLDLFDETGGFHLVDDLLLRFCLANKVGVCTRRGDESLRLQSGP